MSGSAPSLLRLMVREEWRLNSRLFGGRRFALLPAFVASVAAGTAAFFALADADAGRVVAGLHLVVALLGLQVGTVGLVGRDALEDLLGDTTLLLFSARTLPVAPRRLLVAFVLKDVGFYAALFVVPLVVGLVPLVAAGDLAAGRLPLLVATTAGMFALGVGASFALVGLHTRSRYASTVGAVVAIGVVVGLVGDAGRVLALTPYGLLDGVRPLPLVAGVLLPPALGLVGLATFRFGGRSHSRTAAARFDAVRRALGSVDDAGLVATSLLAVARSSGGLWKVLFSQGLVFAVLALLLAFLPDVVPVRPQPGLTVASVLALGSFTTYNWLCQFDDAGSYLRHPVTLADVFRAKLVAFCLLALPAGLLLLALGGVVFGTASLLVGAAVFVPLSLYVFGVTAFLAGLEPTDVLFDTPVFAGFTAATMAVLLPLVVAAIAYPLWPAAISVGSVAYALLAAVVGHRLYRQAGPRWERRALAG